MININKLNFYNNTFDLKKSFGLEGEIKVILNKTKKPFDVVVSVFNKEYFFFHFAKVTIKALEENNQLKYEPDVLIIVNKKPVTIILLDGIYNLVKIDVVNKKVNILLEKYRKKKDDQSFYWEKFLDVDGEIIYVYESGVAKLDKNGMVKWHKALRWDDELIKTDNLFLYYCSEYRKNEKWKLGIKDGEIKDFW